MLFRSRNGHNLFLFFCFLFLFFVYLALNTFNTMVMVNHQTQHFTTFIGILWCSLKVVQLKKPLIYKLCFSFVFYLIFLSTCNQIYFRISYNVLYENLNLKIQMLHNYLVIMTFEFLNVLKQTY